MKRQISIREKIRFNEICGKPVALFDEHHYALLPWCVWANTQKEPVRLLSMDYHTDKHAAFLRFSFDGTDPSRADLGLSIARRHRQKRLKALSNDEGSVVTAIADLRHDEHIDAALRCGILDIAFVISKEDQGYLQSAEQINFDKKWRRKRIPWWMQGIQEPRQTEHSIYNIPQSRLVILENDVRSIDDQDGREARDDVLESSFLRHRLSRIDRICETGGVPKLFDHPFILDIDLDTFNTRKAVNPDDAVVLYDLIRRAIGITIAREPGCVTELQLEGEGLSSEWLETRVLEHIERALA